MQENDLTPAITFMKSAHAGQTRKDGSPYWTHPLAVQQILHDELGVTDPAANLAALLHDTVEDTPVTLEQITEQFGADVAVMVRFLTNRLPGESKDQAKARYHAEMRTAPDCVRCIKVADRIHNLREMKHAGAGFRKKYLPETKHLIEVLAGCSAIGALQREYELALETYRHEC